MPIEDNDEKRIIMVGKKETANGPVYCLMEWFPNRLGEGHGAWDFYFAKDIHTFSATQNIWKKWVNLDSNVEILDFEIK